MIEYDEIKAKADEFEIHTSDVQRDYVFGWLIAAVAEHTDLGPHLVLKGGNALRKGYFPATRFSDDLDYSSATGLGLDLVTAFNEVCEEAGSRSGVVFDTSRNRLVDEQVLDDERRIQKLRLYFRDFTGTTQEMTLKVRVDVTELDRLHLPVQARRLIHPYSDSGDCNVEIPCVKLEEALADKLRALLQRQHSHDLFDLVYGIFVSRDVELNRLEVIRTFLAKSAFQRNPGASRDLLLQLPFELMRGFWEALVMPRLSRLSFDDAVERFTAGLIELFAPFAVAEKSATGFFPAEYRAAILTAGVESRVLRMRYKGVDRLVEPYALVFKQPQGRPIREYFYAWQRQGGSGTGIRSFFPEQVEYVAATEELFEPRFPIELRKDGDPVGGYFKRSFRGGRRPSSGSRPARRARPTPYSIRCPVCGRTFARSTRSTNLRPHKDGYGNRCPGRRGYRA